MYIYAYVCIDEQICNRSGRFEDFMYAVKMVDKVETPVAEIKKEAEMMKDTPFRGAHIYTYVCIYIYIVDKFFSMTSSNLGIFWLKIKHLGNIVEPFVSETLSCQHVYI